MMHRKHLMLAAILIMVCATTATAFAARARFKGDFSSTIGSLIMSGELAGLGQDPVLVTLQASGNPVVTCTNQGGSQAPGQNPPTISASGQTSLSGSQPSQHNGTYAFRVETNELQVTSAKAMGCPNNTWTATIDFVFWTDATIQVFAVNDGLLLEQKFLCTTTRAPDSVSCTPTP